MSLPGTAGSMHNPANDKSLVARPDDYDGAEAKYQVWKRQVRIFLHAHQTRVTTDEDKILLIASYMKTGKAQRWVQPIIDEILDGKSSNSSAHSHPVLDACRRRLPSSRPSSQCRSRSRPPYTRQNDCRSILHRIRHPRSTSRI